MPAGKLTLLDQWLVRHHGIGEALQYFVYRCEGCRGLVTWRKMRAGGCPCGTSNRIRPTDVTWWEKLKLVALPSAV